VCLTVSYASDILDRVTNITYRTASGEIVRAFSYAYDLSGMITQKVDATSCSSVTNVYTYDGLNRLLSETIMQSGTNTLRQFTYVRAEGKGRGVVAKNSIIEIV
jgi:hypothetical protein